MHYGRIDHLFLISRKIGSVQNIASMASAVESCAWLCFSVAWRREWP
ncbi:hypothetical protein T11_6249 [Trichinella zimbabwensis]|uniref:Uncharacterized protein n=1 Tax=Trichinella zimbabwensis TaxID=268475 RepID=A0A0V1GAA8_9BILA|nr:hypothetical protein T11_6249 [Trichinella zimbabwensis]